MTLMNEQSIREFIKTLTRLDEDSRVQLRRINQDADKKGVPLDERRSRIEQSEADYAETLHVTVNQEAFRLGWRIRYTGDDDVVRYTLVQPNGVLIDKGGASPSEAWRQLPNDFYMNPKYAEDAEIAAQRARVDACIRAATKYGWRVTDFYHAFGDHGYLLESPNGDWKPVDVLDYGGDDYDKSEGAAWARLPDDFLDPKYAEDSR